MDCAQALEWFNAVNLAYVGSLSSDGHPEADDSREIIVYLRELAASESVDEV